MRLCDGHRVLVGIVGTTLDGLLTLRVSSPIAAVDRLAGSTQTTSGRAYRLDGPPAQSERMLELLVGWLADCGHGDAVDATDTFWRDLPFARLL